MSSFIVYSLTKGDTRFYTGKAGPDFVALAAPAAFRYDSWNAARNRATNLNRRALLHGFVFEVAEVDEASIN